MKSIALILFVSLFSKLSFAQSEDWYKSLLDSAFHLYEKGQRVQALTVCKEAFNPENKAYIGKYDLTFGTNVAIQNDSIALVFRWLNQARTKGLGHSEKDVNDVISYHAYDKLHCYPEWDTFVRNLKRDNELWKIKQQKATEEQISRMLTNGIVADSGGRFNPAPPGNTLYFRKLDTLNVPYIVYVPGSYSPVKSIKLVIYLHGGVANIGEFPYKNINFWRPEPVFTVAERYQFIVLYPFGKKSFGWFYQEAAFKNVIGMIKELKDRYNINQNEVCIGGMSNGGSAAFWYAAKHPELFKGYFSFSGLPELEIADIPFDKLSNGKPFYSIHAKDDSVYKFKQVRKIYDQHKDIAPDWHLEAISKGGHGFIYNGAKGLKVIDRIIFRLLKD